MLHIPVLETERLRLREFREADLDTYAGVLGHREVMLHMGGPVGRDDAWWSIAHLLGHWALRGYGIWAVEEKASRAAMAWAGRQLPAQPIVSLVHPDNERSAAVARRVGAVADGFHVLSDQRVIVFRHPVP